MDSFKVGDKIIYPNQGLGIIEDIREQALSGEKFKIYYLRILANNALVMIPSSSAQEIGVRKPVSEDKIGTIFEMIKTGEIEVTMNWKGRYKEHVNLMKSGSLKDMVFVLKGLYYLSLLKPLSFREKKMMEKARDLIVTEISLVCELSPKDIDKKIAKSLTACFKNFKAELEL